jgi:hypothetical protein
MSQQTEDFGEMGRDYRIAEEGAMCQWLITTNFDGLRHFLTTLEEFIKREESHDVADIEKEYGNRVDWAEHYPSHWQDIIGTQLRQSYIVSLMSATEWHLKSVCEDVEVLLKKALPKHRGPDDLHKFLKGTAEFSAPSDDAWDFVDHLRECRNFLVHRMGLLEGDSRAAQVKMLEGSPGFKCASGFVEIKSEFCLFAHERIERFFKDLHEEYVSLCRRLSASAYSRSGVETRLHENK